MNWGLFDIIGSKNVIWKNALGQSIGFDNRYLFIEYIDMTGITGVHTVESLAFADGQRTIRHQLGAKVIPCSFAFRNVTDDDYMKKYLTRMFCPLLSGTLTVYTRTNEYQIKCYPLNEPTFQRDKVPYVWRFDVDFAADLPYWKAGTKKVKAVADIPFKDYNRILYSGCPFDIAPEILLPASDTTVLFQLYPQGSTSKSFTIKPHDYPVRVITQSFDVVNDLTKEDCSQLIDATAELDEICIRYGNNIVSVSPDNGVTLEYYNLSMGEV